MFSTSIFIYLTSNSKYSTWNSKYSTSTEKLLFVFCPQRNAIRRDIGPDFQVNNNKSVCSRHFKPEDFTEAQSDRRILRDGAVPCRNQRYFKSIFLLFFETIFFCSGTIYFLHSRFACNYNRHTILFLLNMLLDLMYKAIFFLYK